MTAVPVLAGVTDKVGAGVSDSSVDEGVLEGVMVGGKGTGVSGTAVPVPRSCTWSS